MTRSDRAALLDSQRVVVTGIGLVTPLGNDASTTWAALLAGRSGVDLITQFDHRAFKVHIAAEVRDFDPLRYVDKQTARRMDRFLHFATAAALEALADAGLEWMAADRNAMDPITADHTATAGHTLTTDHSPGLSGASYYDPRRVGVVIGSGIGGVHILLEQQQGLLEKGPRRVSPFAVPGLMLNSASAHISITLGARGPNLALATACATGTHSVGEAAEIIRRGQADMMVAGGSEAAIVPMAMAGFENMGAMSTYSDEPQRASRPFDAARDGFVMGEGAGILILERLDRARARGARIYGEIVGYGCTTDAYHITAPAEDGGGAAECMSMALETAGLPPSAVDYINAHGTSTPLNDASETRAIKMVFGDHAYRLAVSSTKSMTGHLMGAAGAVEAAICLLTLHHQVIPPTINYETPDPVCDLDYVPNIARQTTVNVAMSNSFGFGGHNGTVLFRRLT